MTFNIWIRRLEAQLESLEYFGPFDKYSFLEEYDRGLTPVEAAANFVKQLND